jgi:hypothetical protein
VARTGRLGLNLSESLAMVITLRVDGDPLPQVLSMFRVPALIDGGIAWGGALGGTAVILDLTSREAADSDGGAGWEIEMSIVLSVAGESGREALRGIGFAQAFERSEALRIDCPQLLPEGGVAVEGVGPVSNMEMLEAAAVIAAALTALEERDGADRVMPEDFDIASRLAAQMTFQVLGDGEVSVPVNGEFELPFPAEAVSGKALPELTDVLVELPAFTDQRTGVMARQQLIGIEPLGIGRRSGEILGVRLRAEDGGGRIVLTPVETTSD